MVIVFHNVPQFVPQLAVRNVKIGLNGGTSNGCHHDKTTTNQTPKLPQLAASVLAQCVAGLDE